MEIKFLEVLVMDNGEILCLGKTIGYRKDFEKYLIDKENVKRPEIKIDEK